MRKAFLRAACALVVLSVAILAVPAAAQCISYTGTTYSQNFDTLANSGTSNALALTGWYLLEVGTSARVNQQYAGDNGASNTGDTYSYGAAASTDRALGSLHSGTITSSWGACFTNNSGATVTALQIGYTGEEWRLGTAGRTDEIDFAYSTDATDLATGTWTAVAALNFVTPDTATTGAKDGNAVSERTAKAATLSALSIPVGATFWIRWTDPDAGGADDGLAVDDFSLAPVLPSLSVADASVFEGNSGTTTLTFTVTMSATSPSDVTFNVMTADDTATVADNDYVAIPSTQKTIPAGQTSVTVDVTVNGDLNVEPDETFDLFLSAPSANAQILDGLAVGTIKNDDGPPNLTIADASTLEGDVGTKNLTFTVSLAWPAPAGGVTFDIATADVTATAGSDYVAQNLTGQTIPAGSISYTLNVPINGDIVVEPDETFNVNVTNVTGAIVTDGQAVGTILNDDQTPTLIHDIQGNGAASPMAGSARTIDGIVTASFQAAGGIGGFFVEEEQADWDADPATSEGIYVFNNTTPVAVGDHVQVAGTVLEYNNLTEISPTTKVSVLSSGNPLPPTVEPPMPAPTSPATDWERFEGMLVHFTQPLYITDTYYMSQYGEIGLSSGGQLIQPTNFVDPNDNPASGTSFTGSSNVAAVTAAAAANANNLITLDDGRGGSNTSPEFYDPSNGATRLGNSITGLTGVMTYQFGLYYIEPTAPVVIDPTNPRLASPPSVGAAVIKVGFQNTLNFFVDVGTGRGAADINEFNRQRAKLVASLSGLGADVIGLSELQKLPASPQPQNAAAQSLAAGLTTATGHAWAAITDPWGCETLGDTNCNHGTDPDIKCGIIYDTTKVTPVGSAFTDLVAAAGVYSRAPYAQVFTINATGGKFALVVNHLKAKSCTGATGADADQGDGQACWNARRLNQALTVSGFVSSAAFTGVAHVLVMGDMNSYAQEDPIDAFRASGFVDLLGSSTSYNFSGQSGRIDHALASASMAAYVTGATVWHINADEPAVTDYITSGKPADAPYAPDAYRSSDHDPVLVGITGTVPVTLTSFQAE